MTCSISKPNKKKGFFIIGTVALTALLAIVIGLSVGLSSRNTNAKAALVSSTSQVQDEAEDDCEETDVTLRRNRDLQVLESNDLGLYGYLVDEAAALVEENEDVAEIIGGNPLEPGEHPYHVSMGSAEYNFTGQNGHWCSGTIITPNVVLSAAECFTDPFSPIGSDFEALEWVDIYRYNLTDDTGVDRVFICDTEFGVGCNDDEAYVIRHGDFNRTTFEENFALIILPDPVVDITPIALNDDPDVPSSGLSFETIGWGATDGVVFFPFADVPKTAFVDTISNDQCTAEPYNYDPIFITEDTFCAGGPEVPDGRVGACALDNGGPAIIDTEDGPLQIGLVSFALFDCSKIENPAVYMKLSSGIDWIEETVCNVTGEFCPTESPTASPSASSTKSTKSSKSTKNTKSTKSTKTSSDSKCSKSTKSTSKTSKSSRGSYSFSIMSKSSKSSKLSKSSKSSGTSIDVGFVAVTKLLVIIDKTIRLSDITIPTDPADKADFIASLEAAIIAAVEDMLDVGDSVSFVEILTINGEDLLRRILKSRRLQDVADIDIQIGLEISAKCEEDECEVQVIADEVADEVVTEFRNGGLANAFAKSNNDILIKVANEAGVTVPNNPIAQGAIASGSTETSLDGETSPDNSMSTSLDNSTSTSLDNSTSTSLDNSTSTSLDNTTDTSTDSTQLPSIQLPVPFSEDV
eukprot:CAMPEP_0183717270 /NCGR_PEP_ID=MMETSP0737-20130205/10930_1 /TAXON_ID=385413 /ORGANISM="Thalassiosira miniscula, Strain CCMP1093" /LENGTH=690 /DNA_ID=CAMNT_0025946681 /DNA_START=270 /DNA_END=2342 /DNA_ORIENTATION=+